MRVKQNNRQLLPAQQRKRIYPGLNEQVNRVAQASS